MPGSTHGPRTRLSSRHSNEPADQTTSAKSPQWKHQPALLGIFLVECKSHLPGLDSRYRSMISRRTHMLRGKTIVDGKAHLLCHRDGLLDGRWSWEDPAPADVETACSTILDEVNAKALLDAHIAAGSNPDTAAAPTGFTAPYDTPYSNYALSEEDKSAYIPSKSSNDDLDYELGLTFVGLMANQTKAIALLSAAGDSFVALLARYVACLHCVFLNASRVANVTLCG